MQNQTKNTAVVVFSHYPEDPRVRRETEALENAGHQVDVICLRKEGESRVERLGAIKVYRIPVERQRNGKIRDIWGYAAFTLLSFVWLSTLTLTRRYALVHIHNMPDILVFCALLPKLLGAKVILDLRDSVPEIFMSKYSLSEKDLVIRILTLLERFAIAFAHHILTPNAAFARRFIARGCLDKKITIVMNSPQETIFAHIPRPAPYKKDKFRVMYHGTVVERQGLSTALLAMKELRGQIPGLQFDVYGEGDFEREFEHQAKELDLLDIVTINGHISLEGVSTAIQLADLGIIPNKKTPLTEINLPTPIFEYLAMATPVVAPRTEGIADYFAEDALHFFEAGDANSLAQTILTAYQNPELSKRILRRGQEVYEKHTWAKQKTKLLRLIENLLDQKSNITVKSVPAVRRRVARGA